MVKPSSFNELLKIYSSYKSRTERSSSKVKLCGMRAVQLDSSKRWKSKHRPSISCLFVCLFLNSNICQKLLYIPLQSIKKKKRFQNFPQWEQHYKVGHNLFLMDVANNLADFPDREITFVVEYFIFHWGSFRSFEWHP